MDGAEWDQKTRSRYFIIISSPKMLVNSYYSALQAYYRLLLFTTGILNVIISIAIEPV